MFAGITELLANPLIWKVLFSYFVFNAAVDALPPPKDTSSQLFVFVFRFSHALGGNLKNAAKSLKIPGSEEPKP